MFQMVDRECFKDSGDWETPQPNAAAANSAVAPSSLWPCIIKLPFLNRVSQEGCGHKGRTLYRVVG